MNSLDTAIRLNGTLRLSDSTGKRTAGGFCKLVNENKGVFQEFFGMDVYPGSLNIDILAQPTIQENLDAGKYPPAFVIPKDKLVNMPGYIGDGQAWQARLEIPDRSADIQCWVFRRIGSLVPKGILEIIALDRLSTTYGLAHGDPVVLTLFAGAVPS